MADDDEMPELANVEVPQSKRAAKRAKRMTAKAGDLSTNSLFVRNLPFTMDTEGLVALFSEVGPVKSGFVVRDKETQKSRGFGLVHFAIASDAESAKTKLTGRRVESRQIAIDFAQKRLPRELTAGGRDNSGSAGAGAGAEDGNAAMVTNVGGSSTADDGGVDALIEGHKKKSKGKRRKDTDHSLDGRTIVVSGLPKGVTKQHIYKRCKKIGAVELPNLVFPTPGDLTTAFVTYGSHKDARTAVKKLDAHVFKGATLKVLLKTRDRVQAATATEPEATGAAASGNSSNKKFRLIVRNLPFTCNETLLRKACVKYGPVEEVHVVCDKETGKPRGFAFIGFKKPVDAARALSGLNGSSIGAKGISRKVAVDWTVPKKEFEEHAASKAALKAAERDEEDGSDSEEDSEEDANDSGNEEESAEEPEDDEPEDGESEDDESEDDESEDDESEDDESEDDESDDDEPEDGESEDDESEDDESEDDESEDDESDDDEQEKSQDVQEGRTLFVRNVSFDSSEDSLRECFSTFGTTTMCKLVQDYDTGRHRGTAFVQFQSKAEADACLARASNPALESVECDGRSLQIAVAVDRRQAVQLTRKNAKERDSKSSVKRDSRNLNLLRVGVMMADSPEFAAMSSGDRMKRINLEAENKAKIKNPNYSVSQTRLSVHNIPITVNEKDLKQMALEAGKKQTGNRVRVLQSKIVRSKDRVGADGKARSRGFGFLQFEDHEAALAVIQELNNNGALFGREKRPIVMFAWEDAQAIRKQLRRREQTTIRSKHTAVSDTKQTQFAKPKGAKRTAAEVFQGAETTKAKKIKVKLVDPSKKKKAKTPAGRQQAGPDLERNRGGVPPKQMGGVNRGEKSRSAFPKASKGGAATMEAATNSRSRRDRANKAQNEGERLDSLVAKYTGIVTGTGRWFD